MWDIGRAIPGDCFSVRSGGPGIRRRPHPREWSGVASCKIVVAVRFTPASAPDDPVLAVKIQRQLPRPDLPSCRAGSLGGGERRVIPGLPDCHSPSGRGASLPAAQQPSLVVRGSKRIDAELVLNVPCQLGPGGSPSFVVVDRELGDETAALPRGEVIQQTRILIGDRRVCGKETAPTTSWQRFGCWFDYRRRCQIPSWWSLMANR